MQACKYGRVFASVSVMGEEMRWSEEVVSISDWSLLYDVGEVTYGALSPEWL
jgi:hypothetical protein